MTESLEGPLTDPRVAIGCYRRITWRGLLCLAFAAAGIAYVLLNRAVLHEPTCEGKVMRPGDMCLHSGSKADSYESALAKIQLGVKSAAVSEPLMLGFFALAGLFMIVLVFLRAPINPPPAKGLVSWHGRWMIARPHFTALALVLGAITLALGTLTFFEEGPPWHDYLIPVATLALTVLALVQGWPKPAVLFRVDDGGVWIAHGLRRRWIPWPSVTQLLYLDACWIVQAEGLGSVEVSRVITDVQQLDFQFKRHLAQS